MGDYLPAAGTPGADLSGVATIHRYVDALGWYLKDDAGFFKYQIDYEGQQLIVAEKLADGAEVPSHLLRKLRNGHLRRITVPATPPLLRTFPFAP